MTDDTLLIDVLRAAGHEDAANLASKLLAREATPAATEATATPATTALSPAEAERRAEGEFMLAAMKRDIPGVFR